MQRATDKEFSSDEEYQRHILQGVSRTFALTIPELPEALASVVSNAYLLCRIADTVEDETALGIEQKQFYHGAFISVVRGLASPAEFAAELYPLLSQHTLSAERDLIRNTQRIIRITHGFNAAQRAALERCVTIMCDGMERYERSSSLCGLKDLDDLNSYCYHVAGVVGEMLTELFCDYSPQVARHKQQLLTLAVSFGQGLQMTNILKDMWDDNKRGVCWLPQNVFRETGFELQRLSTGAYCERFGDGLETLIGIAHGHLRNALEYTLLIPASETGIRRFCLWAIGLAVLTLRKIHRHLDFTAGSQVKITRRSVRATILATNLTVRSDQLLRILFHVSALGLPPGPPAGDPLPSRWYEQSH